MLFYSTFSRSLERELKKPLSVSCYATSLYLSPLNVALICKFLHNSVRNYFPSLLYIPLTMLLILFGHNNTAINITIGNVGGIEIN